LATAPVKTSELETAAASANKIAGIGNKFRGLAVDYTKGFSRDRAARIKMSEESRRSWRMLTA
jgi:hypothetical protein